MAMTEYRSDLPERPARIERLPLTEKGYPVLWFAHVDEDGRADLRVVGAGKFNAALKHRLCWICGQPLGRYLSFVLGPLGGINRVTSEPPQHRECSLYSVKACPFLTRPLATRNDRGLKQMGALNPGGTMIARNAGAALVWVTRTMQPFRAGDGVLIKVGDPTEISFWACGRPARRQEIVDSIESGFPLLLNIAMEAGPSEVRELNRQRLLLETMLPVDIHDMAETCG